MLKFARNTFKMKLSKNCSLPGSSAHEISQARILIEKAREFQKNIYFCFIDYAKDFDCVDHNKLENSERDEHTRPPDLAL